MFIGQNKIIKRKIIMNSKTTKRQNQHCRPTKHSLNSFFGAFLSVSLLMILLCLSHCKSDNKSPSANGSEPPGPGPGPSPPAPVCSLSAEASGFNKGDGTADSPYVICTYEQLALMDEVTAENPNPLTAHYKLGSDIDASPSWNEGPDACAPYDGSSVPDSDPCTGWTPLGDNSTDSNASRFTGSLDGEGYVIRKLYLNLSGTGNVYSGLFGYLSSGAKISNVGLREFNFTLSTSATGVVHALYIGGLAGQSTGGITKSYAIGQSRASLSGSNSALCYNGGLLGYNEGGRIANSYARVELSLELDITVSTIFFIQVTNNSGGLVGRNESGDIYNSYAQGNSSSSLSATNTYTGGSLSSSGSNGGLVGTNADGGDIRNSYAGGDAFVFNTGMAPGTLDLESASGGLVGKNTDSGNIRNSYAVGLAACIDGESCTGDSEADFGGLVGENNASISNSYWDSTVIGIACSDGADPAMEDCASGVTGLTPTEMQSASGPTGLGNAFQLGGGYPRVYQCTSCTGTLEYSDELVAGQE